METAEISESLGRGKHTTRHVELLTLYDGLVADTPGFSSIDFWKSIVDNCPNSFQNFLALAHQCRFRECMHLNEPNCAVKRAVEQQTVALTPV